MQLSRAQTAVTADLNQLVRISPDRVQVFVDATLTAKQGKIFDASFALPEGYELLSAVGPAVADWYVQTARSGPQVHITLRSGVDSARIALALLKEGVSFSPGQPVPQDDAVADKTSHNPGIFVVPTVAAIDPDGKPIKDQAGRVAIQLAASLEAHTVKAEGLKSVAPSAVVDWLGEKQAGAVQFAYRYEKPGILLQLDVQPLPTRVRAEILAAIGVRTTAANYTYRLRYTIDGSPIDRVSFTLPTQFRALAAVSCPSLRNLATTVEGDRTRWTVMFAGEPHRHGRRGRQLLAPHRFDHHAPLAADAYY